MTTAPLSERLPGRLPVSPAVALFLAGGWITIGIYFLIPPTAQDVLDVAIGLAGVVAIVVGSQALGAERLAWRLFALGLLCEVAGDAISGFYEIHLDKEPPVPSVADVFYLGGYPLLALGIFLLLRSRGGAILRAGVLDTVIVFVAVATVQWMFFVEQYRHVSLSTSARIVSMAYPSLDALLLVGFAQLMVGLGRRTLSSWLLLASVALWIAGDEIFALDPGHYAEGGWVDTFWLGSYIVWGAAALGLIGGERVFPEERRTVLRLTRGRLALLSAALLAVPAAIVVERLDRNRYHPIAAAIGAAVIAILALFRLTGLVHLVDQARLDERKARRDADAAREQLEEQNAALVEARPPEGRSALDRLARATHAAHLDQRLRGAAARGAERSRRPQAPRRSCSATPPACSGWSATCCWRRVSRAAASSSSWRRSTCGCWSSTRRTRRGRTPMRRTSSCACVRRRCR